MNKLLKSTLIAGGVMGAFFASNANAQSFNVTIDEIELVSDADNYLSSAVTVYKPSVSVGAATKTTVDFFSTSARTFALAKPPVDVYPTMVVHFDEVEVSGTTTGITNVDVAATFTSLFATYAGGPVAVFGDAGAGGTSVGTVTGVATAIPMQPVVVTSTAFSIPEFNWNFPSTSVEESSSAVSLIDGLNPYTLAANVDSSDVPDFMIDVDASVFDGVTGFTSGSTRVTVGLFADADLGPRPMFSTTFVPTNQVGSGDLEVVTFYDIPEGTFYPVAWVDADNDTMLDQGEYVTMHSNTVATAAQVVASTDISYTSTAGELDTAAVAFGYREFDLRIPMGDLNGATAALAPADATFNASGIMVTDAGAGPLATNTWASTSDTALLQIGYAIYDDGTAQISRTFDLGIGYGEETGNADGTIDSGEAMFVVMANDAADDISGVSFVSGTELLTISGIPFTAIETVSAENVGTYAIALNSTDDTTPTTQSDDSSGTDSTYLITDVTTGSADQVEAPVSGSITVVVGGGDASQTDGTFDIIDLGTL